MNPTIIKLLLLSKNIQMHLDVNTAFDVSKRDSNSVSGIKLMLMLHVSASISSRGTSGELQDIYSPFQLIVLALLKHTVIRWSIWL